jgi:hypothetical protein
MSIALHELDDSLESADADGDKVVSSESHRDEEATDNTTTTTVS